MFTCTRGAHAAIETFDKAVLHRLASRRKRASGTTRDVVPVDLAICGEGQDRVTGQFRAVVADNHTRLAAPLDQLVQFPRHTLARDRRIGDSREAFPGYVIDHIQDAKAATAGELIMHEVQRPTGIRPRFDQDRGTAANSLAPGPALAYRQPLFAIEPLLGECAAFTCQAVGRCGLCPKSRPRA